MFEVEENTINVCNEAFQRFVGSGVYVGLFFISILYIISYLKSNDKKDKNIKLIFAIYCVIVLILNLNPRFTKFIITILKEDVTYWRVYWLLPVGINIAYMFTDMIFQQEKKFSRVILGILIVFMIGISGKYMYSSEQVEKFAKVNNYYKVPDNVLDIIMEVSNDDEDYKKIAGPEVFMIYTRQIDGNIILAEGRGSYYQGSLINLTNEGSLKDVCEACINKKCNYLVLRKDRELTGEYLLAYDIKKIRENEEYILYKFNRVSGD